MPKINRRDLLKGLIALGISPTLIPKDIIKAEVKEAPPKSHIVIKAEPLTMGDDDMFWAKEELPQYSYYLYAIDEQGNETFLKKLTLDEFNSEWLN